MNKKAFTLTELLVVVVIVGVLAAVVLPKFSKVVETRKVTEAEDIMSAIRTEQEARCTLGKSYLVNGNSIAARPQSDSHNFTYEYKAAGMEASSTSEDYVLKMPSYADGRICCEGPYCEKLNRNYVACSEIKTDDVSCVSTAAGEEGELEVITRTPDPTCDTSTYQEGKITHFTCTCGQGDRRWHCGADTNYEWKYTTVKGCSSKPADKQRPCPQGQGTQTATYSCVSGKWTLGDWTGACKQCEVPSPNTQTQKCGCSGKGTKSRTFDEKACVWGAWTACSDDEASCCVAPSPATETQKCGCTNKGTKKRDFDISTCSWGNWGKCSEDESNCCVLPAQTTETQKCGCTNKGTKTRTFDSGSCAWGEWSKCTEDESNCCVVPSPATETQKCGCTNKGTKTRTFNKESCAWSGWSACTEDESDCCVVPAKTTETETCGCTGKGTKTRSFDKASCSWGGWSPCTEGETNCVHCSNSHSEGEVTRFDCVCGQGERKWHCGQDTGYVWTSQITKDCVGKPKADTRNCPDGGDGTQTRNYTCVNGQWKEGEWTGTCPKCSDAHYGGQFTTEACACGQKVSIWNCGKNTGYMWQSTVAIDCVAKPADETRDCPNGGEGGQTRSYSCVNGQWKVGEWTGACPKCSNEHYGGQSTTEACECGQKVLIWNCGKNTGYMWKSTVAIDCVAKPADETRNCPSGVGTQTKAYTCVGGKWKQGDWTGACCQVPSQTVESQPCGCFNKGQKYRGFNTNTCSWSAWGGCNLPEDDCYICKFESSFERINFTTTYADAGGMNCGTGIGGSDPGLRITPPGGHKCNGSWGEAQGMTGCSEGSKCWISFSGPTGGSAYQHDCQYSTLVCKCSARY